MLRLLRENAVFVAVVNHKLFLCSWHEEKILKKRKCKKKHCSPMSSTACCDINVDGVTFKSQESCHTPRYKSQKQSTFIQRHFQLKGAGFKNTMKKTSKGLKKCGKSSLSLYSNKLIQLFEPVL